MMDNKSDEHNIDFYNEGKSKKHTAWNFINSLRQKGDDQSKALLWSSPNFLLLLGWKFICDVKPFYKEIK